MEILSAEVVVTNPGRNYVLVKLETDDWTGWGDATLNGREQAVASALEYHILPEIVGRDADRIEDIWQFLFRNTYWRGGPVLNSALSGVDMALWDLKGKRAGIPVYDLLGGRTRDYASVYQHCGAPTPKEIVANVEDGQRRGIGHFRVNLRPDRVNYLDLTEAIEGITTVRERLGPGPELIVDVHGRVPPIEAARIARGLAPVNLFFLEDPVRPEYPGVFEFLRGQSATPIAMGELFTNPWEMVPLVENDLVDFIRVDLAHIGGITPARKLAAVGEHHYVRTAFHGPSDLSPVGHAATVHLDLALANFGIQELSEHEARYGDPIGDVFQGGPFFVEGSGGLDVSDEPGLGIEVNEDAARQYEYDRDHLPVPRNPDGSVADW